MYNEVPNPKQKTKKNTKKSFGFYRALLGEQLTGVISSFKKTEDFSYLAEACEHNLCAGEYCSFFFFNHTYVYT